MLTHFTYEGHWTAKCILASRYLKVMKITREVWFIWMIGNKTLCVLVIAGEGTDQKHTSTVIVSCLCIQCLQDENQ